MNRATIILSIVSLSIILSCIFAIAGGSYLYFTGTGITPGPSTTTTTTITSTTPEIEEEPTTTETTEGISIVPAIKANGITEGVPITEGIKAIITEGVPITEGVLATKSDDDKRLNFTEKEVFLYSNSKTGGWTKSDAYYECPDNTVLATEEQLKEAQENGADWCAYGWTTGRAGYPQKTGGIRGCSDAGSKTYFDNFPSTTKRGLNCYGIKPNKSTANRGNNNIIIPFNNTKWSQYSR